VPGTVLTTLIDRGVYPDYDYGLNNMAIPESLARQDYWYRTVFDAPLSLDGKQLTLTFKGINYAAEVWINGSRLGNIRGAFIRGVFDVTAVSPGHGHDCVHVFPRRTRHSPWESIAPARRERRLGGARRPTFAASEAGTGFPSAITTPASRDVNSAPAACGCWTRR
jgi:hypothetical protein